jgi:hypothetical protein
VVKYYVLLLQQPTSSMELARRGLRLRLYSLQFPFQPLQSPANLIGSNRHLVLITVTGVNENGDVLQPFLHKGEVRW